MEVETAPRNTEELSMLKEECTYFYFRELLLKRKKIIIGDPPIPQDKSIQKVSKNSGTFRVCKKHRP